jgi:hypothetical protein
MKRGSAAPRGGIWLPLIVICTAGSAATDGPLAQSSGLDSRIARIDDSLMPPVIIKGQERHGFSITERMEYYNVPGVSIAVTNKGGIWSTNEAPAKRKARRRPEVGTEIAVEHLCYVLPLRCDGAHI